MTANKNILNRTVKGLFTVYCIIMIWLLFGQRIGFWTDGVYLDNLFNRVNLIPFATISSQFERVWGDSYLARICFINLAGNIVMFIPLGFFIPLIWSSLSSLLRFTLCITVTIVSVEIIQLFTLLGSFDIDDYILNFIGALIGFGINHLGRIIIKKIKSERQ